MLAPPDPEMLRAPLAGRPQIAKSEHQKQRYHVAPDSQAALFLLARMIFLIAILAFAGGPR
jgi:hypothetical protein